MWWTLLFFASVLSFEGEEHIITHLKRNWTHSDYPSFDHYWNDTFGSDDFRPMTTVMKMVEEQRIVCKLQGLCPTVRPDVKGAAVPCTGGSSGGYECDKIDMLSFVSLNSLGSGSSADGNDIWGYINSAGEAFALTGQTDGMSIVEITDRENPVVLAFIQSQRTQNTVWRDIKIYENVAFIVADGSGHGLQYIDLDQLIAEGRAAGSRMFVGRDDSRIRRNTGFSNCHNIALNEKTGHLYMVGSNAASGGLYIYDVKNTADGGLVSFVGQFPNDGYTHDTECITYNGPDTRYTGREICFGYNENSLTIVDVTNPGSPQMVSRTSYNQVSYTHQGWIESTHSYLLMNDELDESRYGLNTRTLIWDVRDLQNPEHMTSYFGPTKAIDHNLYIKRNLVYEANYRAGMRVLDISNIAEGELKEVAYFKTWTGSIAASFNGAWSSFPYYDDAKFKDDDDSFKCDADKTIVVQDIEQGLFVLCVQVDNS